MFKCYGDLTIKFDTGEECYVGRMYADKISELHMESMSRLIIWLETKKAKDVLTGNKKPVNVIISIHISEGGKEASKYIAYKCYRIDDALCSVQEVSRRLNEHAG